MTRQRKSPHEIVIVTNCAPGELNRFPGAIVSGGGSGGRRNFLTPSRPVIVRATVRQIPISASKARLSLVPTVLLPPERRALTIPNPGDRPMAKKAKKAAKKTAPKKAKAVRSQGRGK